MKCDTCMHKFVCIYKNTFITLQKTIKETNKRSEYIITIGNAVCHKYHECGTHEFNKGITINNESEFVSVYPFNIVNKLNLSSYYFIERGTFKISDNKYVEVETGLLQHEWSESQIVNNIDWEHIYDSFDYEIGKNYYFVNNKQKGIYILKRVS